MPRTSPCHLFVPSSFVVCEYETHLPNSDGVNSRGNSKSVIKKSLCNHILRSNYLPKYAYVLHKMFIVTWKKSRRYHELIINFVWFALVCRRLPELKVPNLHFSLTLKSSGALVELLERVLSKYELWKKNHLRTDITRWLIPMSHLWPTNYS